MFFPRKNKNKIKNLVSVREHRFVNSRKNFPESPKKISTEIFLMFLKNEEKKTLEHVTSH